MIVLVQHCSDLCSLKPYKTIRSCYLSDGILRMVVGCYPIRINVPNRRFSSRSGHIVFIFWEGLRTWPQVGLPIFIS